MQLEAIARSRDGIVISLQYGPQYSNDSFPKPSALKWFVEVDYSHSPNRHNIVSHESMEFNKAERAVAEFEHLAERFRAPIKWRGSGHPSRNWIY